MILTTVNLELYVVMLLPENQDRNEVALVRALFYGGFCENSRIWLQGDIPAGALDRGNNHQWLQLIYIS